MNDDNHQNQPSQTANDYQNILDEYAASVKPEVTPSEPETAPITPPSEEPKIIKLDEVKDDSDEKAFLKDVNSLPLEPPVHPSLAANLDLEDKSEKPLTGKTEIFPPIIPSDAGINPASVTPEPVKSPEEIKAEIDRILSDDNSSNKQSTDSLPPNKPKINIFKILFIVSLIIFFGIAGLLTYTLLSNPSDDTQNNNSTPTPTVIPTVSDGSCELNGNVYQIGESFASADGCNTCSCQSVDVITCTEKACNITPEVIPATKSATVTSTKTTVTPTKSATSSTGTITPTPSLSPADGG